MKFNEILEPLQNGKRVRRESSNMWELYELNVGQAEQGYKYHTLLLVTREGKNYGGKNITPDDLLATDWEVVENLCNIELENIEDLDIYEIRHDGTWVASLRCMKYKQDKNCNIEHCFYDEFNRPIVWGPKGNDVTVEKIHILKEV